MSLWSRAAGVAAQTPHSRNRLVDFLRAVSILAVISGHWLLTAPWLDDGRLVLGNMLEMTTYTRWLSWLFQVMPVFFLVGGYANAVSWRAALRDGKSFPVWLDSRLRRLIRPVLLLIAAWAVIALLARIFGIDPTFLQECSKIALVPIWFLAIYAIIVLFVPLTHAAWQKLGFWSFFISVGLAVVDDALFLRGFAALGWLNYLFVWIAVHQLGYAWLDNRLPRATTRLAFGLIGLALLVTLTVFGPYPISMISMPGAEISNTLPPKIPLLALGLAQAGILLALERPLRSWLDRPAPWTLAVLLNGMIMTIYLWHSTAMILVIALTAALGNPGFGPEPGSTAWWLVRPVWFSLYILALAGFMPLVARLERSLSPPLPAGGSRLVAGALICCVGLALLAYFGLGGPTPGLTVQIGAVVTPFAGAAVAGLLLGVKRPVRD